MNKIVDGVELLRMIRDGEIEENQKIKDEKTNNIYTFDGYNLKQGGFLDVLSHIADKEFAQRKFEILSEEDKEIDIQAIEELDEECYFINELAHYRGTGEYEVVKQQNEIIKALKQLDKKIKE